MNISIKNQARLARLMKETGKTEDESINEVLELILDKDNALYHGFLKECLRKSTNILADMVNPDVTPDELKDSLEKIDRLKEIVY